MKWKIFVRNAGLNLQFHVSHLFSQCFVIFLIIFMPDGVNFSLGLLLEEKSTISYFS